MDRKINQIMYFIPRKTLSLLYLVLLHVIWFQKKFDSFVVVLWGIRTFGDSLLGSFLFTSLLMHCYTCKTYAKHLQLREFSHAVGCPAIQTERFGLFVLGSFTFEAAS